jgi:Protein of unknown function (DUF1553)/Protein of unknown function (DUF1549)/Planctomycete cytochrome C
MRSTPIILSLTVLAAMGTAQAAEPTKEQLDFFEKKVRPILSEKCYKCHSVEAGKSKGGLTLDTQAATLKGGEGGPAVVPGDISNSLLITAVSYKDKDLKMPPDKDNNKKLSDQEIASLTEWVKMGAPDPRTAPAKVAKLSGLTDEARNHWAYQPVKKPAIPSVRNRPWCITPVDAFIVQKLEEKQMLPARKANPETLLRRATYDLTGLPPTPEEINAFMTDGSPNAFAKVVDRLLASPHYGERWGRFWLDTARYSDTSGDRTNNGQKDYRFPYAWTYRDYVVRAFNEDKPYDRFIMEQLAADQLSDLEDQRDLAALGFITVGDRTGSVNDIINDRIDTVTKGFLALTVACARCHDHKFDPIPTKDYYALHGIFNSISEPQDKPIIEQADKGKAAGFEKELKALEKENRDFYYTTAQEKNSMFRAKAAEYLQASYYGSSDGKKGGSAEDLKKSIEIAANLDLNTKLKVAAQATRNNPMFSPLRHFKDGTWASLDPKSVNPILAAAIAGKTPKNVDDLTAVYAKVFEGLQAKAEAFVKASVAANTPDSVVTGFTPDELELINFPFAITKSGDLNTEQLRKEVDRWPLQLRNSPKWTFARMNKLLLTNDGADARAMVVADLPSPRNSSVFIRGQAAVLGDMVPRHFLEILSGGDPKPFKLGSGRMELAEDIASKKNPLTARVIVNRVWLHHFGEGFVRTPDDLGTQSEKPTHQELLDYLSVYLMDHNWSLKSLHKLIMLSAVYQESSATTLAYEAIDPDNRLLWRANVRRLDFEAMRDSLLVISGKLDGTMFGQPVNLTDEPYSYRRSIYGYVDRGNLPELMQSFDFSNPSMPNSKRSTTVVPQQALFLMNSPMAIDVARSVMGRVDATEKAMREDNTRHKIYYIYRIVFQRAPHADETEKGVQFINREIGEEANIMASAKAMAEKAEKKAQERAKQMQNMRDNGTGTIENTGELVERKPLTAWETYTHALLLSNEAAYVN